jgi:hypothetical protein
MIKKELSKFKKYIKYEIKPEAGYIDVEIFYVKAWHDYDGYWLYPDDYEMAQHMIEQTEYKYDMAEFYFLLSKKRNYHKIKTLFVKHKFQMPKSNERDLLQTILKEQKEKEILLEKVLRSKINIDGLIEDRIREFLHYKREYCDSLMLCEACEFGDFKTVKSLLKLTGVFNLVFAFVVATRTNQVKVLETITEDEKFKQFKNDYNNYEDILNQAIKACHWI